MVALTIRLCDPFKSFEEEMVRATEAAMREAQQELDQQREHPATDETEIEFVDLDFVLDAGLPLGEDECRLK